MERRARAALLISAMPRIPAVAAAALCLLGLSHCATDACACPPAFVPAIVVGRVLGGLETPVPGAVMDLRGDATVDSAQVELVLHSLP